MNNTTGYPINEYDSDVRMLLEAGIYINNYYLWLIFAFGFPGNLASVVTILRMQRVTTSTFYVATLAIVDNFAIVLKLLYNQLTLHEVSLGSTGCKIIEFISLLFPTCANWLLVFIATERFVAVRTPLKIGMYWTIPRAVISVICLGVLVVAFYGHVLWTYSGDEAVCIILPDYLDFYRNVWYWFNSALYSFGPCILLTTLNFFIIQAVRKSTVVRKQLSMKKEKKAEKTTRTARQDKQITLMLVSVSVVFVILTVPRCIYVVVHLYWEVERGTMEDAQKYLLDQVTFVLCDSNHAINFYLYFITGKKFRRHFLDLLFCRKRRYSTSISHSGATLTLQTKYKPAHQDGEQKEDTL